MQRLVANFAQERIHHDEKANGWAHVSGCGRRLMTWNKPIGMLTPTNFPFCSAGPVEGTKFPSNMPMVIARIIHSTKNLSRKDRPLRGGSSSALSLTGRSIENEGQCRGMRVGRTEHTFWRLRSGSLFGICWCADHVMPVAI